jgi:tetratricopeptide (TPR) repeat protein
LRGAIAWSYELLDGRDQRLFACLSVFIGGAGLEAAEAVCKPEAGDVLTGLESLVDNSLVSQTEGAAGRPRLRMLETLREFAGERLRELGRDAEVRRRHGEWYADLAERLAPTIMGPEQRRVLDLLEEEHDNLRSAISWSIQNDRADLAMRLTSRLWRMWQMRGHLDEGLKRAIAALAMPGAEESPELRADALEAAGGLAYWLGDIPQIKRWYEEALAARRALGDPNAIAEALYNLAFAFAYGKVDIPPEDLERARRLSEEALDLFRRQGNASGEARALWQLATVLGFTGDYAAVEEKASRAEAIFRELGDRYYLGWTLWSVGVARVALGRFQEAHPPVRESLQIFAEADDVSGYVGLLDLAATIAFEEGDRERAAILSGGVASLERATGMDAGFYSRFMLGFEPTPLQTAPDTAQRWEEGAAMDPASIIAYAIEGL